MRKRARLALLLLPTAALFLLLNRAAYKGYFQDDDLATMAWTWYVDAPAYLTGLLSPQVSMNNFRPVGHFYYHIMMRGFGLNFPVYLVPLHLAHLLNIWLFWMLARRLGLGRVAATAGAFFFGFHAALFDAWWKPMYVFDVLCTTFCLLSLLLYTQGRWILSLLAMWMAFKSKELAIMLPAVLLLYEIWFGKRQWKRTIPFVAVSLLFGIQALILRPGGGPDYELHLSFDALAKTIPFYASKFLMAPLAGLALLALPFLVRDRRVWFGIAAMCLFFVPLLLLPERLFAVYWYLPLTGAALALAAVADGRYRPVAAVFLFLWIPWDFVRFRDQRRVAERLERQNRSYVTALEKFSRSSPQPETLVWDGGPDGFHHWGVIGAIRCVYRGHPEIQVKYFDDPGSQALVDQGRATLLHWDRTFGVLHIARQDPRNDIVSYLKMEAEMPAAQLRSGWYRLEDNFRWTEPDAAATLLQPAGPHTLEMVASVAPEQVREVKKISLRVMLNGRIAGSHDFTRGGWQTLRWPVPDGTAGTASIEFHTTPAWTPSNGDPRVLGIALKAFGFVTP